jgi:hypothetical protein
VHIAVQATDAGPKATLEDARNFKQFHVTAPDDDQDALEEALAVSGVGRVDGDHVWVDRSWLEAQGPADPEWREGLAGMLGYAASKGWTSADGRAVRAHVERP